MPLSEKARGKQRVDTVEPEAIPEITNVPKKKEVTVRFTEGVEDLVLYVGEKDKGSDVRTKVSYFVLGEAKTIVVDVHFNIDQGSKTRTSK